MKRINSILFVLAFCLIPLHVFALDWHAEGTIVINKPGLLEAELLPELHERLDDGLDLKVFGPDGKSRSFELYWREDKSDTWVNLTAKSARLENNIFIWEAFLPPEERIKVKSILISVLSENYIGSVDIFGFRQGSWIKLSSQSALYSSAGTTRGDIKIEEGVYEGFRLEFTAYAKKPVPIGRVQALGEKPGKDYVRSQIDLNFQRKDTKDDDHKAITNLTSALPGSGIYIQELELFTTAQFNGNWILERQDMLHGRKTFVSDMAGSVTGVEKGTASLKINVNRVWPGNTLNLKLTGTDAPVSNVKHLNGKVRLPRLVFLADMPGTYFVRTGLNHKVSVLDYPSANRQEAPVSVKFDAVQMNRDVKKTNPAEHYQLKGAPFNADGYSWRSSIKLSGPGYYRFILHQKGSLEDNIKGLRIVRNGLQYPYFIERGMTKKCELTLKDDHNQSTNTTTWYIELPQASSRWSNLILEASGIFNRKVKVERDQPRPVHGIVWHTLYWSNVSQFPSELAISLKGFPKDETKIRLTMAHGDNQPVKIEKAAVTYDAPAVHFLADSADGYELYGGSKEAHAPSYDMQLVQHQLQKHEPLAAELSEPEMLKNRPLRNALIDFFKKNNWGLYAVLGLLSFGLIAIIVFVFPKTKKQ